MNDSQMEGKVKFPYPGFPFRLSHKEGKDNKICWFQTEDHCNKYITRNKLKTSEYEISTNGVALVGKGTGRKGKQKGPRSR